MTRPVAHAHVDTIAWCMQFHTTRESADELEAYLKQQEQRAKEAEFQALAKADLGEGPLPSVVALKPCR